MYGSTSFNIELTHGRETEGPTTSQSQERQRKQAADNKAKPTAESPAVDPPSAAASLSSPPPNHPPPPCRNRCIMHLQCIKQLHLTINHTNSKTMPTDLALARKAISVFIEGIGRTRTRRRRSDASPPRGEASGSGSIRQAARFILLDGRKYVR